MNYAFPPDITFVVVVESFWVADLCLFLESLSRDLFDCCTESVVLGLCITIYLDMKLQSKNKGLRFESAKPSSWRSLPVRGRLKRALNPQIVCYLPVPF